MEQLEQRQVPMERLADLSVGENVWFFWDDATSWLSGRVTAKRGSWYTVEVRKGDWSSEYKFNGSSRLYESFDALILGTMQWLALRLTHRHAKDVPSGYYLDRLIRLAWMLNR